MSEQTWIAAFGVAGTIAAGVLSWIGGRRKGAAEATTMVSADNREWAGVFLARLNVTEAKLDATEAELEAERQAHAATRDRLSSAERKIEELQREMAALIKEVRRLGGHVPGETPAHGTPLVEPVVEPGMGE